jgi:ABC-type branched-subunit amino acid transport system ATPase component
MTGISKRFGATRALDDVSLDLERGEVHALVGENGAGKSTLIKVMTGIHQPDEGVIFVDGEPVVVHNAAEAQKLGIAAIYQEPLVFPDLSVAENIFIGRQDLGPVVRWRAMCEEAEAILARLDVHLDPREPAAGLPVAAQQAIEIAKAISLDVRVLIMDEPTASLSAHEVERLFRQVRRLRESGVAVLFISHRLDEVLEIADRVTVFRDGHRIWTKPRADVTRPALVTAMVGREAAEFFEHNLYVVDLGVALGSRALTVWLADGMNHPGQASFRGQFDRVLDGLRQIHAHLPDGWELYTEHKPYEPAFYSSVNNDWGTSLLLAQGAGERAKCLVDLGHHLPNTNIEQVVSRLAMVGRLGGFHFNDSKYGDDDLTVGSITPFQLFLIVGELLEAGGGRMPDLAYMIDESHNLKDPLEDLIQATDALQIALAQALVVNRDDLAEAQEANDPARAAEVLHRGFRTDVRPLVAEARRRNGAAIDPVATFRAVAYRAATIAERGSDTIATGL